jgi:superfamily II DNA/RNA helicase
MPRQNRTGEAIQFYAPPGTRAVLRDLADAARRKLTAEILLAIEEHLRRHGRHLPGRESVPAPPRPRRKIPGNPPGDA